MDDAACLEALQALSIAPTHSVEHAVAPTVDDGINATNGHIDNAIFVKNLFLRCKKNGLFLLSCAHDAKIDMKKLPTLLNLAGANLRMADAALLQEKLAVPQGSVSPLAVMNDKAGEVTLVLDKKLVEAPLVAVHPLRNDRTITLAPDALLQFVRHHAHEPKIVEFGTAVAGAPAPAAAKPKPPKAAAPLAKDAGKNKDADAKGMTFTKVGNFPKWYEELITKSEMIEFYDISGCYILRPWSYSIWDSIRDYLDAKIKTIGVQNCYFPIFVSEAKLQAEKDHIEDFAPEVAWVTKSGDSALEAPIAIRPTSETIMYPAFKNWIHSHRDLPLKLNQWNNVVRWEFKHPTPFLRTREFLWQEGHTAHATREEADVEVLQILDFYAGVYEELLAVPVIKGKKTEKEKFAGGDYTTTVEAYIPVTGRSIQGATSHQLGLNFGKMFNIQFSDEEGKQRIPWQNSWGLTTRTIGVMCMVHGDDKGLVLPPRVAPIQAVIVTIPHKEVDAAASSALAHEVAAQLEAAGIRTKVDDRHNYSPGWKYSHWELKGVPLRLELGPKDMQKRQMRVVRRDTNDKEDVPLALMPQKAALLLVTMQHDMMTRAKAVRDEQMTQVWKWEDFTPAVAAGKMILTPFCNEKEWEETVKDKSKAEALELLGLAEEEDGERSATPVAAKTLCIPYDAPALPEGTPCFVSGKPATCWVLWGRSY